MAKRKASNRKAPRAKTASLPKGYKAIEGFTPFWKFAEEPLLEGKIMAFGEQESQYKDDDGKKKVQRTCTIKRKDNTEVKVSESAMLSGLFEECDEGENVAIVFKGKGTARGGRQAPNIFEVGYK